MAFSRHVQESDQIDNWNRPQLVRILDSLLNHKFNYGNSSKAEHWRLMERSQGTDNGHTWRSMQDKCMCGISNRHQQLREYSICTYCTVLVQVAYTTTKLNNYTGPFQFLTSWYYLSVCQKLRLCSYLTKLSCKQRKNPWLIIF